MIRRTQAERSDGTTAALTRAARELFGRHGYAATSIDAVAAAAGVTKGAAYHHFGGKAPLFRAAVEEELVAVSARLERVAAEEGEPWAAVRRGAHAFLEHCLDPGFRRIVLLDAPSVLGWETVREMEHAHLLRVLHAGFELAATSGPARDEPAARGGTEREGPAGGGTGREGLAGGEVERGGLAVRARLVFGALCEGGMLLARSPDPAADLPRLAAEAGRLLESLRP
ncbi:TetR/AcrR family transcriptional regulator [Nonomuraea sp. NPDC050783]|uniref:TetR/AcrR family transcriptional regulator n=1 Tax=Nonomuraea sp. NPDC050783 TaxID=3154634 RepID=UPI0034674082